ncbi:MAG: ATP-binding protein [Dehalococcoidia bacterium]
MESLGDILRRLPPRTTSAGTGSAGAAEELEPASVCPVCKGMEWVLPRLPVGHPDFGKALPCRCQEQDTQGQRLARLQRYSNLGPLVGITFQDTDPQGRLPDPASQELFRRALEAAQAFAEEPRGWLVLTGPSGSGKTHLAAAIANRCIQRGVPALFVLIPDLLDHLRAAFAPSSDLSYDELFDQVRNTPLLLLDDLGAQASTPWAQEKLYQVLNHRFNAQLPTVVTLAAPLERLDERLRTRLEAPELSRVHSLGWHAAPLFQQIGGMGPEALKLMTFEGFDLRGNGADAQGRASLEAALRAARNFARDPDGWLVLAGEHGCGKTHLAVAIANHRLEQKQPVFFAFVPALLDHLRATFSPESLVTYDQLFEQVKTAPLLILDDLGSESSTPWAEEKLYQIIVHRHNARLPTVITTASAPEGIKPGIGSRLKDPRVAQLIAITAPDYRDQERLRTPRRPTRRHP